MLDTCATFRAEQRISSLWELKDERLEVVREVRPWWTGQFVGLTRDGSPVQYNKLEFLRPSELLGLGDEPLGLYYLWWMESSLGLQRQGHAMIGNPEAPMPRSVEIFDCKNLSMMRMMKSLPGVNRFAAALSVGQLYYPENLRKAFVINAPSVFTMVWNLISGVLSAETLSKVQVVRGDGIEELKEFLDEQSIEAMFSSVECPKGKDK